MAKISTKGSGPAAVLAKGGSGKTGAAARKNKPRVAATTPAKVRPVVVDEPVTHRLALWGLLGLLFFPAFFSGMFFPPAQEKGLIVAAVIFWLTWVWKYFDRDNNFLSGPLDYFALALPLAALAAGIGAADYSLAVNDVVKYILYFLVFWSVARLTTSEHIVHQILHAVYLSAVGVALAGLAIATGLVNVQDGFVGGRIYSTFQYPNATASYLAAALFLGLYLWHRAKQFKMPREIPALARFNGVFPYQFLYAAGNFILLATLVGTQSIGGFLVFAAALVLYLVVLPGGNRTAFVYHFVTVLIAAAPAVLLFLHEVAAKKMGLAWLMVLAGAVCTLLFQWGWVLLERRSRFGLSPAQKRILAVAAAVLALVVLAAGTFFLVKHPVYLNKLYVKLRGRDMIERGYFYLNALAMFARRPVLGWGGGGWQAAYRMFQGYLYNSNQVHSYYLQLMVEMGAVGILVVIGLWYSFLRLAHRLFHGVKKSPERQLLVWTVTMVAVEIGAHAVIDFDLALSALFLVVWVMFGLTWALRRMGDTAQFQKERKRSYVPFNHTVLISSTAFGAVAVLLGLTLAVSNAYAQDAAVQYAALQSQGQNQSQYQENLVVADLHKAAVYNPLDPAVNRLPAANVYGVLATMDLYQGKAANGVPLAEKAVSLAPYEAANYDLLADLYDNNNQPAQAVQAEEKAVSLAPFQQQWYDALARTDVMAGIQEINGAKKNPQKARGYFEASVQLPARMTAQNNTRNPEEKQLQVVGPPLAPTAVINLSLGIADYFLGNYGPAAGQLASATQMAATQKDTNTQYEAMLWHSLLDQKTGQTQEAATLLAQVKKDQPSLAASYDFLKGLSLADNAQPAPAEKTAGKPAK